MSRITVNETQEAMCRIAGEHTNIVRIEADGKPILDTLDGLYRKHTITDFMEASYCYCQKFEKEFRQHIQAAEQQF